MLILIICCLLGSTYFAINPKNYYLNGNEGKIVLTCQLQTDLVGYGWSIQWMSENQNVHQLPSLPGLKFKVSSIDTGNNSSNMIGSSLTMNFKPTIFSMGPRISIDFYCSAVNTRNSMSVYSLPGKITYIGR